MKGAGWWGWWCRVVGWWGERDLERAEAYNPAGGLNQWKSEYKSDFEKRR